MHMDIFNDDAFSAVSMTEALEDIEFKPGLITSMNLFEPVPITTTHVSVEKRDDELSIIATSERGAPLEEAKRDRRNIRLFETVRIAKGDTIKASEIQNVRAFGTATELETMAEFVGRRQAKLVRDVELTWEHMALGAIRGVVVDADGTSVIENWFENWGILQPAFINFALNTATTEVELKCRAILRQMQRVSKGAFVPGSGIIGLAGDEFFDKLTTHKSVKEKYEGHAAALMLNQAFGAATQAAIGAGSFATFAHGGITFINYRGLDDPNSPLNIAADECQFFPVNAENVFEVAYAPGEAMDMVNTLGRPLYSMLVRDDQRNFWVRPEVYSYPLFICKRPQMLLRAKVATG